jgi:hypothetical protein
MLDLKSLIFDIKAIDNDTGSEIPVFVIHTDFERNTKLLANLHTEKCWSKYTLYLDVMVSDNRIKYLEHCLSLDYNTCQQRISDFNK